MAGIGNLTGVFALMNRKMIHRTSFRFGLFIGYGFAMMLARLMANLWNVSTVMRHHPEFDYSGFFRSSFMLVSFYGICVIPMLGARSANGILGHPRLSVVNPWKLEAAHSLFSVSRLPFLGLLCVLALYSAEYSAVCDAGAGNLFMGIFVFIVSSTIFAFGNISFHRTFRHLKIRLPEAELVLLAAVVLAVFVNPQPAFRSGFVTLPLPTGLGNAPASLPTGVSGLSGPWTTVFSIPLVQLACIALDILLLAAMRLFESLEDLVRRKARQQVFTKLVFGRLTLSLPLAAAFAEWYILAWPGGTWVKIASTGGIALYTIVRMSDAFAGAGDDIFRLFRRRPGMRHFQQPVFICIVLIAAPFLLRAAGAA